VARATGVGYNLLVEDHAATPREERPMKIAIASDHGGYRLKDDLRDRLRAQGHEVTDLGGSAERSDYPDIAAAVGRAVSDGRAERGVLVCGSGIGVAIAANKVPGVRAATIAEPLSARLFREHNDGNVVCMGERLIGPEMAWEIVQVFLSTDHQGGRHSVRVEQIRELENHRGAVPAQEESTC
jgi:ribose 5-phosphate isomerase B